MSQNNPKRLVSKSCICMCLAGVAWSLTWAGCSKEPEVKDPIAIEVGGRQVTLSELQAVADFMREQGRLAGDDSEQFVERFVDRAVALEKARQLGLDQDVELQLQWENLLIGRLKQADLQAQLDEEPINDEMVLAHYQANIDQYTKPAQVKLALLFLEKKKGKEMAPLVEKLEAARLAALELPSDTKGFGALAMTYSEEATSRFKGGDIGWLQAGAMRYRWPQQVVDAGFALESGQLSDVIETDEGVYLLKKIDARASQVRPLDESLRATLQRTLLKQQRAMLQAQVETDWAESVEVKRHDEVLSTINFLTNSKNNNESTAFTGMP